MDQSFGARLKRHPVVATLYGIDKVEDFIASAAEISIVANVELRKLIPLVDRLLKNGKAPIVNIDSCEGLSQDKGGVDYLADIGVTGLVSTRVATVQRGNRAGLITIQKVFVTDRSNWPRSTKALEQSSPHMVQLMPAPMLGWISLQDRNVMPPVLASGFVCNEDDIRKALSLDAIGVSTSETRLWQLDARKMIDTKIKPAAKGARAGD